MECPNCGKSKHVLVTDSRRSLGSIRRRRRCGSCKSIFYTWEIDEKSLTSKRLREIVERLMSRDHKLSTPPQS